MKYSSCTWSRLLRIENDPIGTSNKDKNYVFIQVINHLCPRFFKICSVVFIIIVYLKFFVCIHLCFKQLKLCNIPDLRFIFTFSILSKIKQTIIKNKTAFVPNAFQVRCPKTSSDLNSVISL